MSKDFNQYRCINPPAVITEGPWFREKDICDCDPEQSNFTGRGYIPCAFGSADGQLVNIPNVPNQNNLAFNGNKYFQINFQQNSDFIGDSRMQNFNPNLNSNSNQSQLNGPEKFTINNSIINSSVTSDLGSWLPQQIYPNIQVPDGSQYPTGQYQIPQLDPRPLVRIGNTWRNSY